MCKIVDLKDCNLVAGIIKEGDLDGSVLGECAKCDLK